MFGGEGGGGGVDSALKSNIGSVNSMISMKKFYLVLYLGGLNITM